MKLSVKGKQLDVGDALRSHVESHLGEVVAKYFGDSLDSNVTFSREGHSFRADIMVHAARGLTLQSNGSAAEPYPAFDTALTRLSGRLRRHKTKIKQHHHEAAREQTSVLAKDFVLSGDDHQDEVNDNPTVVAEMETKVETLTVGEAVMRLDLGDLPALLFRNKSDNGLNMIYRRADGHIGWVNPAESAKK